MLRTHRVRRFINNQKFVNQHSLVTLLVLMDAFLVVARNAPPT